MTDPLPSWFPLTDHLPRQRSCLQDEVMSRRAPEDRRAPSPAPPASQPCLPEVTPALTPAQEGSESETQPRAAPSSTPTASELDKLAAFSLATATCSPGSPAQNLGPLPVLVPRRSLGSCRRGTPQALWPEEELLCCRRCKPSRPVPPAGPHCTRGTSHNGPRQTPSDTSTSGRIKVCRFQIRKHKARESRS